MQKNRRGTVDGRIPSRRRKQEISSPSLWQEILARRMQSVGPSVVGSRRIHAFAREAKLWKKGQSFASASIPRVDGDAVRARRSASERSGTWWNPPPPGAPFGGTGFSRGEETLSEREILRSAVEPPSLSRLGAARSSDERSRSRTWSKRVRRRSGGSVRTAGKGRTVRDPRRKRLFATRNGASPKD